MARFKKGQSGNPAGRPKGCRDSRTDLRKKLAGQSQAVMQRVVDACLIDGDMQACRIIADRILSPLKSKADNVEFQLDSTATLTKQAAQVLAAVAEGEIDPVTGKALMDSIAGLARITEIDELSSRLTKLEEASNESKIN